MILDVYLRGKKTGILMSTADRGIVFSYLPETTRQLSVSLPVTAMEYPEKACLPFFSGLLPDGIMRMQIANQLHVSETSTFKLLAHLGGECAGAVTLLPEGTTYQETQDQYEPLSDQDIGEMIDNIAIRPLLSAKKGLRLSLAGAQQKIPLAYIEDTWMLPHQGSPSTHIIKPDSTIANNEYVCLKLASKCGISTPEAKLVSFKTHRALVVTRYDRNIIDGNITRLHQEDLCQALGIVPERKYEEDGGPGYNQIFPLLHQYSAQPALSILQMLKLAVFNYLIGNCDAHAKNYSFLYPQNGNPVLAPAYDLVSTTLYPELDTDLAMAINGERRIDRLTRQDFLALGSNPKLMDTVITTMVQVFPQAISTLGKQFMDKECISVLNQIERQSVPHLTRLRRG